jgi:hypothetical protein
MKSYSYRRSTDGIVRVHRVNREDRVPPRKIPTRQVHNSFRTRPSHATELDISEEGLESRFETAQEKLPTQLQERITHSNWAYPSARFGNRNETTPGKAVTDLEGNGTIDHI